MVYPLNAEESLLLDPPIPHDIFLSHSGVQKGFAKDLYRELRGSYSTFLDITHHSLPLGESFPNHIFHNAKTCQLAVVVLSDEFVRSKWPMLELCTFIDAGVRILPLFYKLSPDDLKCHSNCRRWEKQWKVHASRDAKQRIDVSKWARALATLCSHNGLAFDPTSEGEQSYLDRVVLGIHQIVPLTVKFDTCQIRGKDRLCQVILHKFKEMEISYGIQGHAVGTKVSVLGLYGLAGSGKSTLCKCLRDHFLRLYGPRKTLYLEMPSHPSRADVVHKFKELLHLTDFRDRINLDNVSELEQVEELLKTFRFPSCRVFLVVDNISEKSWELVHRILHLGVGLGSKLILVARTLDVLHPTLHSLEGGHRCICDSIATPSINEIEAIEILLQTARASYMAWDKYASYENLTLQEKKMVQGIVHMCSFHGAVHLPLVMKAIGAMLVKYEGDLENWGTDLERFWTTVKTCKEDVVQELVGESFKALLNEQLQLLFLDVALFISRLQSQELQEMEEVISCLCVIHGSTSTRIRMMIKDLRRHCFLTVSEKNIISVHDVYLEFAKSIQNGISKFLNPMINWCWKAFEFTSSEAEKVILLKETMREHRLRTLILKVGKGCQRVDLQGFSCLKAVVMRNCRSLKVLGLAGLSSLACLVFENCASLSKIDCSDIGHLSLHNVRKLRIVQTEGERSQLYPHVLEWERQAERGESKVIMPLELGIACQMRNMQAVYLQNTGIRRLENIGSYWPQLQDLSVIEGCLEAFHLGNLPCLKWFRFSDHVTSSGDPAWPYFDRIIMGSGYKPSERYTYRKGDSSLMLPGKDLLAGCPQLKELAIKSAFFEKGELGTLPSRLSVLRLHRFFTATELPDLSLLAHNLEWLDLQWCEKLKRVDLGRGFNHLQNIVLLHCNSLVEVSGLEFLPNLKALRVLFCQELQSLMGFHNSNMLECLWVFECSKLQKISSISHLMSLKELRVVKCSSNLVNEMANADLQNLVKLRQLALDLGRESCLSVRNLENLESLHVFSKCGRPSGGIVKGLEDPVNLKVFRWRGDPFHVTSIQANNRMLGRYIPIGCLRSIQVLTICDVCDLGSMDDIEYLHTLENVSLERLKNLRSVQGLELLHRLQKVFLTGCLVLEELPCLFNTKLLKIDDCPKLKVVKGYDAEKCMVSSGFDRHNSAPVIRLERFQVRACPSLEELPSLQVLVNMQALEITDCPKLKAVEGCDDMKCLVWADIDGCKSIACLPFDLQRLPPRLVFRGCKFASNAEAMVALACDKTSPRSLRCAAVDALLWEYYQKDGNTEQVVEGLFACFLSLDDKWIDVSGLAEMVEGLWICHRKGPFPAAAALDKLKMEMSPRGKLTRRVLLQDSHGHHQALRSFLNDVHVATLISQDKSFHIGVLNFLEPAN